MKDVCGILMCLSMTEQFKQDPLGMGFVTF